jgi:single-stranded-DNA-specific exonuclease
MPSKRWIVAPPLTETARAALADYAPVVAQLLFNRGLADADAARLYFAGQTAQPDGPQLLRGLPETVERSNAPRAGAHRRLRRLRHRRRDGHRPRKSSLLDANVEAYIPDREDEGYGLNDNALRNSKTAGA